jgi:hypothetical protein
MHSNETQTYPTARKCSPVSHSATGGVQLSWGYWTLLRFPTLLRSPGLLADMSPDLSPPVTLVGVAQVTAAVNVRGRSACTETLRWSLEIYAYQRV